jgi:hypothetical protein
MLNSVHPDILAAAVGGVIAFIAVVVAWFARSSAVKAIMIALALIFLLPAGYVFVGFNPWLVDSRFRTYRAFYRELEIGMTREQVLAAMERRYPADGPRKRPTIMDDTPRRLGFFMNPEASREPNC